MHNEIILVIGNVIGATITASGTYIAVVAGRKIEAAKRDAITTVNQIISYHRLEKIYAELVAKNGNESSKTVLTRMRSNVKSEDIQRPTMMAN